MVMIDASMTKADANRQRSVPGSEGLSPEAANHAVREYLDVLDDAAFGVVAPVVPKLNSPADPASRWSGQVAARSSYCPPAPDERRPSIRQ